MLWGKSEIRQYPAVRRVWLGSVALLGMALMACEPAHAYFVVFKGGLQADQAWKAAAQAYTIEKFEGFGVNTAVPSLPALALQFETLTGGAPPGIYIHNIDNTPYGPKQLGNFPGNCCIDNQYQYNDLNANVTSGSNLYGLGFWNGDPQGTSELRVYDRNGGLLGVVSATINTGSPGNLSESFGGFLSSVPVGRLEWEGSAGDGWNHYDGLEVTFVQPPEKIPEPISLVLLGIGVAGCHAVRRRRRTRA